MKRNTFSKYHILFFIAACLLLIVICSFFCSDKEVISSEPDAETVVSEPLLPESPDETTAAQEKEQPAVLTLGIDVSSHQDNIDWVQVASAGIDFAMIRVGYRTMESGEIKADSSAAYNMQQADAHGIQLGVYFFSTAVTEEEAEEEAHWVAEYIAQYPITYPVVYDCENYEDEKSRQYTLTIEERTKLACVFMDTISKEGYTPMFYGSRNELEGESKWLSSILEANYPIWLSRYTGASDPTVETPDYSGKYSMWQYCNDGIIDGIDTPVDCNVAYFGYDAVTSAKDPTPPEKADKNPEAGHSFTEVEETVTAKDATNLRDLPSQDTDSHIVYTLQNGETVIRTGVSTSGWSRILYKGQTLYAVSSLLTTDLAVKEPEPSVNSQPDNGIQTTFTACDDMVSPKIEVNLRNIPSITNDSSSVVATAKYGEVFRRTGINEELGWSRVEYNGQTLYCVSSYIYVYEAAAQ